MRTGGDEDVAARGRQVIAKAYDNPIPGFQTSTVGNLRLWEALPLHEFDLAAFNKGDYVQVCLGG